MTREEYLDPDKFERIIKTPQYEAFKKQYSSGLSASQIQQAISLHEDARANDDYLLMTKYEFSLSDMGQGAVSKLLMKGQYDEARDFTDYPKSFYHMRMLKECVCSNYDYVIHDDVVAELKRDPKSYAEYPCSGCHCKVWWNPTRNQFGCQVHVRNWFDGEFYKDSMEEVIEHVRKHWSDD